jgi:hypothetical protein
LAAETPSKAVLAAETPSKAVLAAETPSKPVLGRRDAKGNVELFFRDRNQRPIVDCEDEPGKAPRPTPRDRHSSRPGIPSWPWRLGGQVLVAGLLWCSDAPAADFELNGRVLGARIEQVLNDERYDCGGESACFLLNACALKDASRETLHGASLDSLVLYYAGERVAGIEAQFATEHFERVLDATLHRYGQAQSLATRRGTAGNEVYLWQQGHRLLRLERFAAQTGRSSIIIAERSLLAELVGE